jgi:hypothetical protein
MNDGYLGSTGMQATRSLPLFGRSGRQSFNLTHYQIASPYFEDILLPGTCFQ